MKENDYYLLTGEDSDLDQGMTLRLDIHMLYHRNGDHIGTWTIRRIPQARSWGIGLKADFIGTGLGKLLVKKVFQYYDRTPVEVEDRRLNTTSCPFFNRMKSYGYVIII